MTREEATNKYIIPALKKTWNETTCNKVLEAISVEPCEGCVSREYILSKAHCCCDDLADDEPCCVDVDDIKNAPSVQPMRPKGKWVNSDYPDFMLGKCTNCGFNLGSYTHNFCPNCGADMRGE